MLEFKDVSVVFHEGTTLEKKALDNVSIHIRPGEFVTILGSNGAGKSTFFNAISGLVSVKSGQILLEGKDITHLAPRKRAKIIGRLYQNPAQGTAPHLSVEENLALSDAGGKPLLGFAAGRKSREYYKEVLRPLDMGLEERMKTPIGQLSGG